MPETAVLQGTSFRLCCLGPVTFTAPDGAIRRFRTRKQMGLLLYLARCAGRPRGREHLVEMLWEGDDPRAARHSLAQSISLINKVFGVEAIRFAGKDQVALRESLVWLDVDAFERAAEAGRHAEARQLWRGSLLEGLWVRGAPAFEAWLDAERQRLTRLYRAVLHAAVEAERTAGNWAAMRRTAESLLDSDPLDENAMLGYLEALTLGGDRTLALRRYAEFEERLRDELHAEPGAPLKTWIKRHRRGDEPPAPPVLPRVAETQTLPAARPVYGREEEFKFLWDAWAAAQQGKGAFIIMEGPAGIGKSALAGKLANQAHVMGGAVCFVRCWRTEKSVPFAPITALLRQLMRLPGFVALNEVWIGELSRLVPELRERYPTAPAPMAIDDSARHRICDGTLQAASCVADEQPLMIIVDDIHNADEATLALLHYFGRQTGTQPMLLICVSRSGAAETELERTFFTISREARIAEFLELGALDAHEASKIVRQVLAQRGLNLPDWALHRLWEASGGVPLQLIESTLALPLPASSDDPFWSQMLKEHLGAGSFEQSSSERLRQLSSDATSVSAVLAVAGRPLSDYEIATVRGLPTSRLASAIHELELNHFVRRSGSSIAFAHERYQAAALDSLAPELKRKTHALLARLLERTAAETPAARCEVARHYEEAGDQMAARAHALQAAKYADSIGATREKATALALVRRVDPQDWRVSAELGRCLLGLQEIATLRTLCDEMQSLGDLPEEASAEFQYLVITARHDSGEEWLSTRDAIYALFNTAPRFHSRGDAMLLLLRLADKSGQERVVRQTAKAYRRSERGNTSTAYSLAASAYVAVKYFAPRHALPWLTKALAEAHAAKNWTLAQWCRQGLGAVLLNVGRYRESIEHISHGLALARQTLDPLAEAMALNDRAVSEIALGWFDRALRDLESAREVSKQHHTWPLRIYPVVNTATLEFLTGRYDAAAKLMEEGYETAASLGLWTSKVFASSGRAMCAARLRDLQALQRWATIAADISGPVRQIHDRCLYESAQAWRDLLINGRPDAAEARVAAAAKEMSRRNIDHWLRLELELAYIREAIAGHRLETERKRVRDLAAPYEAAAIVAEAK